MFKLLCVSNRKLCIGEFLQRVESLAQSGADGLILREKDLSEAEYEALAKQVLTICRRYGFPCALHHFPDCARRLGAEQIHLPLPILRTLPYKERVDFAQIGTSCHSLEDAKDAQELGCSYLTLGHIFATDCKKGLPPRGLGLLEEVCNAVDLPVYAIGGIQPENLSQVQAAGSAGACIMSGFMRCADPAVYVTACKEEVS